MKKLLTMMTAVALGTCAWATESSAVTLLNENFNAWANGTDLEYMTALPEGLWSYSGTLAENELKVVAEAEGDNALALNTGSKVLNAKFAAEAQTIPADTGYYFTSKVTFKDPSDTLPTLGESDKFALVVLDNIESVDAGYTTTPNTNLWIIAKYGESGKRAYQLDVAVTENNWLETEHTVVVKAYSNVMASATCAGFLVKVDNTDNDTVCKVVASYAIDDKGVINYGVSCSSSKWNDSADVTTTGDLGYLGYAQTAIAGSVRQRYVDGELLLSNVPGDSTLASVDFQGQGKIDDVSLATTGADFGADSLVLNVATVGDGVTLTGDTTNLMYYTTGETLSLTFTVATDWVLKTNGLDTANLVKGTGGAYTYNYAPTKNNQTVTFEAYEPAAYVGTTPYETLADALAAAAGGTLKLGLDVTLTSDSEPIQITDTVTLDLAGKTITADGIPAIVNAGTLTIVDTVGNGVVDGAVIGDGTFNITAGSYLASVQGVPIYPVTMNDVEYSFPGAGNGYTATLTDGYYVIAEASTTDYPTSSGLVEGVTEENKAAVETALDSVAAAIGEGAGDEDVAEFFTTVYGADAKVPVATLTGAKTAGTIGLSVNYDLPLLTAEPTVGDIVVEVAETADAAAFSFQLLVGGTDPVEVKQVTDKVRKMIQYGTTLTGMAELAADNANVSVTADTTNKKIKVKLLKTGGNTGFMKVKLNK